MSTGSAAVACRRSTAMAARLNGGRSIVLFPEGTTYDGLRRGRFHSSHLACLRIPDRQAQPGCALVQPVALTYSDPVAAWIGDASLVPHVWQFIRRPGLTCAVRYGVPLAVAPGYDRKALGRALAQAVEKLIERPAPDAVRAATPSPASA
jgi:1-acyl-sn-glycerol-3-phosphate acyltransferase